MNNALHSVKRLSLKTCLAGQKTFAGPRATRGSRRLGNNWRHCRLGKGKRSIGGQASRSVQPVGESVHENVTNNRRNGKSPDPMVAVLL